MSGWFAMNRAMFSHPIFEGKPYRVAAWAWILGTAAWKDTSQDANGQAVTVKRGQLLTSYRQMSDKTGVPVQHLRTLINRLRGEHAIDTDTNTGRLLITIRNYDKYQSSGEPANTAKNTAATQQQHTKEQGNKVTTVEAKASLSAKADANAEISEAVKLFKQVAAAQGWPSIRILSKARQTALRARLREAGGIDGWREALRKAAASNHCNGDNDRGWLCNFDFLTQQKSFAKLMEGNYDNRTPKGTTRHTGASSPHDSLFAGFAQSACNDFGGSETGFSDDRGSEYPSNPQVGCGPSGDTSQPILRVIGSN